MQHWITRFGCPQIINCDQGWNFEAQFFKKLTEFLQIDKTRTTAYHPESNAVNERTNHTLLNLLAKTTDTHQQNWSGLLLYVMLAYLTSVYESTGYTPFFLVSGHEVALPFDLQFSNPKEATWTNYHDFVTQKRLKLRTTYE